MGLALACSRRGGCSCLEKSDGNPKPGDGGLGFKGLGFKGLGFRAWGLKFRV